MAFDFPASNVKGFRAPFLEASANLDKALRHYKYRYDTSLTGDADAWPTKDANGVWRFNLASIPVPGYPRPTLSMDYNFLVLQSGGQDDPDHSHWPRYRQEMFDAYMDYFKSNYEGNRAPIHIGHHFSEFQGGVYKQALMAFAKAVCTIPEVKCVTYSELQDFLEALSVATLNAYQRGDFPKRKLSLPKRTHPFANAAPLIAIEAVKHPTPYTLRASLDGTDRTRFTSGTFEWRHAGGKVGRGKTFNTATLPKGQMASLAVVFRDASGRIRWCNTISVVVGQNNTTIVPPTACCHGFKLRLKD